MGLDISPDEIKYAQDMLNLKSGNSINGEINLYSQVSNLRENYKFADFE